jgi:hypothetical protein
LSISVILISAFFVMCTNFERNLPTVNLSLLLASLFTLLGATLHSEPDCVVDSNVGRVETTPEAVHARLRVFGGKEVEIRWQIPDASFVDGKPIALQVHRVTSARRISIAADELKPGHLTWKWEVPVPKGNARYDISLATAKPLILHIEACDKMVYQDSLKMLASAKISAEGVTSVEKSALTDLGINLASQPSRATSEALLTITREHEGKSFTRSLSFSEEENTVVWSPGTASGDWRVRIPRSWISAASLASDDGRIRLINLLCDSPNQP